MNDTLKFIANDLSRWANVLEDGTPEEQDFAKLAAAVSFATRHGCLDVLVEFVRPLARQWADVAIKDLAQTEHYTDLREQYQDAATDHMEAYRETVL